MYAANRWITTLLLLAHFQISIYFFLCFIPSPPQFHFLYDVVQRICVVEIKKPRRILILEVNKYTNKKKIKK